ncbi:NUDIX hydrolase [Streptomyces triticiradicis]|uniref:NUDIX hydrolase n=1 Tax=Streptomyces triticiradicis TaxID=2651189 RepID=A0A7J5D3E5_9ACTN|nr:NUDIX hydrolase [Streptomyces triticiradicis]KAB1978525.1 NUDIX hydrolase [Streptomyces triticiradicis]
MKQELRVAAYAVCVRDGAILLARLTLRDGSKRWTLPGGGMDHGEDPYDTVIREVGEETGYAIEPTALLGVDSQRHTYPRPLGATADFQSLRIVYEAQVTGGELRHETNGSTDMAAWHPLEEVPALDRVLLVDVGLALWRERPVVGRAPGIPEPQPTPLPGGISRD